MDAEAIKELLEKVKRGDVSVDKAMEQMRSLPFEDLGFARIDHHRTLRKGFPEVILGSNKTVEQITTIVQRLDAHGSNILVTRVPLETAQQVVTQIPQMTYDPMSRTLTKINKKPTDEGAGMILIVTAGTSDIPVAEEAYVTCQMTGNRVEKLYDVGVAGIHRLLAQTQLLFEASVLIVVAGMEGALASVVGGMVDRPVIAVPTSIGYGTSFGGLSALLGMLNSCAPGIAVVNVDNGFGAGFMANLINRIPKGAR